VRHDPFRHWPPGPEGLVRCAKKASYSGSRAAARVLASGSTCKHQANLHDQRYSKDIPVACNLSFVQLWEQAESWDGMHQFAL
jgi:hypothetical protein